MMIKISSSLKKRLITAFILAPIILAITYWAPSSIFAILLLVFVALSAYEWARLSGVHSKYAIAAYILLLSLLFLGLYRFFSFAELKWLFYCSALWWLYIYFKLKKYKATEHKALSYSKLVEGLVTITPAVLAMFYLHQQFGALMVFYLFAVVWGADVGAYFSGKRFGQHKLAPKLSPGKTIEGVAGGLLLIVVLSLVVAICRYDDPASILIFILISAFVACVSIIGDLYESLLKREAGVKDSSRLLPGHGGVLDRIDSILAAAPLFILLYTLSF